MVAPLDEPMRWVMALAGDNCALSEAGLTPFKIGPDSHAYNWSFL